MSDPVEELITRYRSAIFTGQESTAKIDNVLELARLRDLRVVRFFIEIAGNSNEYDLARIEALKALELRKVEPNEKDDVVRMIGRVLQQDNDDDVRSYAARALAGYIEVSGALDIAAERVLDPDEDDDVRHNAFFAIERSKPTLQAIAAMERCSNEAKFREGAIRVLHSWSQRG